MVPLVPSTCLRDAGDSGRKRVVFISRRQLPFLPQLCSLFSCCQPLTSLTALLLLSLAAIAWLFCRFRLRSAAEADQRDQGFPADGAEEGRQV